MHSNLPDKLPVQPHLKHVLWIPRRPSRPITPDKARRHKPHINSWTLLLHSLGHNPSLPVPLPNILRHRPVRRAIVTRVSRVEIRLVAQLREAEGRAHILAGSCCGGGELGGLVGAIVGKVEAIGEFKTWDGVVRLKEVGAVSYFDGLVIGGGFVG